MKFWRLGAMGVLAACLTAGIVLGPARDAARSAEARAGDPPRVVVASKAFPESWILGAACARLAREAGARVENRANLGATEIIYQALLQGSVDVYPEYTGTIARVLLGQGAIKEGHSAASAPVGSASLLVALAERGLGMSPSLGFNDGYALALTTAAQQRLGIEAISDLAQHPGLRLGLSNEFAGRAAAWPGLSRAYHLPRMDVCEIQHDLAYAALADGRIDLTDAYTTDAMAGRLGLRFLRDDRHFFPRYDAVLLYRADLPVRAPAAWAAMLRLVGHVDETCMRRANARVVMDHRTPEQAAAGLLENALGQVPTARNADDTAADGGDGLVTRVAARTGRHLELVGISLAVAVAVGIPLGILATRSRLFATLAMSGTGVMQTIPSLALLAMLVPLMGVGAGAALVALFLYSLLPIVRNTYAGLTGIAPPLLESAVALGLPGRARLLRIYLPLAAPSIIAGVETSAVINVGTATLAALVGAGGLGEPILRGITLLDNGMILEGAIPAALLALAVQGGFALLERVVVPRGLRR